MHEYEAVRLKKPLLLPWRPGGASWSWTCLLPASVQRDRASRCPTVLHCPSPHVHVGIQCPSCLCSRLHRQLDHVSIRRKCCVLCVSATVTGAGRELCAMCTEGTAQCASALFVRLVVLSVPVRPSLHGAIWSYGRTHMHTSIRVSLPEAIHAVMRRS